MYKTASNILNNFIIDGGPFQVLSHCSREVICIRSQNFKRSSGHDSVQPYNKLNSHASATVQRNRKAA